MPEIIDEVIKYSTDEFAAFDLKDRPFLSEQGNTVTRGFIADFRIVPPGWDLNLRDVDYLDKKTRRWVRRRQHDIYSSSDEYFCQVFSDTTRSSETHLEIGGYGFTVFVGPKMDAPWRSIQWADVLGTDCFHGGVLGEKELPGR
ncbi:hypothetical protein [Nioella ostreopsis]|uniref:hypothetical protein n=1 Tax=Nioella ostreopsis TaxID=2448479 RepID=UPI000FD8CAF2|nr:hypothetical protein [Nioella ostreopsis]